MNFMNGWLFSQFFKNSRREDGPPRLRFNSWTLGGRGADLFEKSAEALELERMNPLRGVDEWRLGQIFDDARDGVFADLAWLYNEIEGVEPALMACCDTRESAAGELGWVVRTADPGRTRGFDKGLADEQRAALLAEFGAVADDLPDLAGHMVSAFFRGAAHALPLWNADGSLAGFKPLDLWNFALDRGSGIWFWNADASRDEGTFQPVPPGETVSLAVSSRHVDHAALPIFIRAALGAKRYGVWLDRFGIPPVGVIMPPNAERGEQPAYMDLARKFARGGSGVLPNGSQVTYGTEARSVCPFPEFIRFQQQQIYAIGMGRVQSGENQGDNLGGNAAGVVDSALRRIVRRDARRIARAVNDCVTRRVLERLFPGRPALARFDFDTEERRTGREALEDAGLARNAGLAIDRGQLEEMTGYTLAEAPEGAGVGEWRSGGVGEWRSQLTNSQTQKLTNPQTPSPQNPSSGVAKALQNARRGEGATDIPPDASARSDAILRDFAADMAPAAQRIKSLLDALDAGGDVRDEARKLAEELPELMADDPAMAAVIEEAMAEAFAEGIGGEAVASNERFDFFAMNDNPNREPGGQFAPEGTGDQTGGGSDETNYEHRKRTCREALAKYRASSDHPSADDVASGKVPIETAVEKGFEATFAGHRLVFFTEDKLGVKYRIKDEPGRLKLIPEMLQKKGKMQPQPHKGEQTAFIESRSRENEGKKRLVAVADTETGVVMSVMRADNDYIGKHFRKK